MAKRSKGKKSLKLPDVSGVLKEETANSIWAVVLFLVSLLLVFAAFESAGVIGKTVFSAISSFLGVGYYLLPIIFVGLAVSLLRQSERKVGTVRTIASGVFLLSVLGLVEIAFSGKGGVVGKLVANPLSSLLDTYMSVVVLISFSVVSILVVFDADLMSAFSKFNFFRKKDNEGEEYEEYIELPDGIEDGEYEEEEGGEEYDAGEETEEEEEEESGKSFFPFGKKRDAEDADIQISLYGGQYTVPPISLLEKERGKPGVGDLKANANIIKRTLMNFGIQVEVDEVSVGPTVTRYAIKPAEGVRISKIVSLQNNLELALAAHPVRIEAPIPGRSLVGIEIPNTSKATVRLAALLSATEFKDSEKPLLVSLGRDITGTPHFANLAKMPHVLVAGATGSGKSVTIHSVITSLIYRNSPSDLRFIMIDPKRVELTLYNNIPHQLTPVITDSKKTILALKWAAKEMERRYDILETEQVRDIDSYHKNILAPALKKQNDDDASLPGRMPYIVIVIDELADIMQAYPRELEAAVVRLAQMSRAVGIHLILSTQRPSVNIITGLIKANIPARIALQVSSQIDSRTILDTGGAEKLLGAGDMLYISGEMSKPVRIQTAFISEQEVKKVVQFLRKHNEGAVSQELGITDPEKTGSGMFDDVTLSEDEEEDDLYENAREAVLEAGKASTSYLQRKLRIGYSRAARLIDLLEERGVVGPADGSRPREVFDEKPLAEEETGEDDE